MASRTVGRSSRCCPAWPTRSSPRPRSTRPSPTRRCGTRAADSARRDSSSSTTAPMSSRSRTGSNASCPSSRAGSARRASAKASRWPACSTRSAARTRRTSTSTRSPIAPTTVADSARCTLANQQQIVVNSLLELFPDAVRGHVDKHLHAADPYLDRPDPRDRGRARAARRRPRPPAARLDLQRDRLGQVAGAAHQRTARGIPRGLIARSGSVGRRDSASGRSARADEAVRFVRRGRRHRLRDRARRGVRVPRPERRGQDLDDAHDRLRLADHRRRPARARARPDGRRPGDPRPPRRGAAGGQPRHRAHGLGQPDDLRALLRPAARR